MASSLYPALDQQYGQSEQGISPERRRAQAWKFYGYPGFAKWMASSDDFFVLPKYSNLAARTLLFLGNEIRKQEDLLEELDQHAMKMPNGGSGSFKLDEGSPREHLLMELGPLLQQYYDLVNSFGAIRSREKARDYHVTNLTNWFNNHPGAIAEEELHFMRQDRQEDSFQIASTSRPPLGLILERVATFRRLFEVRAKSNQVDEPQTHYHDETWMENVTSFIIVITGLAMLFGPVWGLYCVEGYKTRLGVITASVVVFSGWLWLAAGPRSFEILAGTAAYTAVLMVYMQIQTVSGYNTG